MDGMTASMMGGLIPAVTSAVQSLQPIKPFSPNYQDYLGSYYNVVTMNKGSHFSEGYLDGTVYGLASPVVFWWDQELDYVQVGILDGQGRREGEGRGGGGGKGVRVNFFNRSD